MRILLITSSARGHALAEALKRSPQRPEIIHVAARSNPAIKPLAEEECIVASLTDISAICEIAKRTKPRFAVIGPEDPIAAGLADALMEIGVPSVAPFKALARLESSKGFARELLRKHGVDASPKFCVFTSENSALLNKFIIQELQSEYVVKYDALKGGKGVKVSGEHLHSIDEGVAYALACIEECGQVVIEEKLEGVEFSLLSFTDGSTLVDMPAVQDHKRAFEGDTGPNTGGMGTYTDSDHSLPFLTPNDLAQASTINRLAIEALRKESPLPYRGILYGGYMATRQGVRLIEFNCRFGDPEALNLLSLLSSDFVAICQAIIEGNLTEDIVRFERKATVCKYIVPKSYPEGKNEKGEVVTLPRNLPTNAYIYLGDVTQDPDGTLRLGTSRSIGVVGIGDTLDEAENIAQSICEQMEGPVRFRRDIGTKELIQKRIDVMKNIRNNAVYSRL